MRIDKYLKISRLIKRRTVAQEACEAGRVTVNSSVAKPSTAVKVGDIIGIKFGEGIKSFRVLATPENTPKDMATALYEEVR